MKESWINLFAEAIFPKFVLNMFIFFRAPGTIKLKKIFVKVVITKYNSLHIKRIWNIIIKHLFMYNEMSILKKPVNWAKSSIYTIKRFDVWCICIAIAFAYRVHIFVYKVGYLKKEDDFFASCLCFRK